MFRFDPLPQLTPTSLVSQIQQFKAGYLTAFAWTMEAIRDRDPVLKSVIRKSVKSLERRRVEVLISDDVPNDEMETAKAQQQALNWAYSHLRVEDAYNRNVRGGIQKLVAQIMDAQAYGYSAHELVFEPGTDGLKVTAKRVPLAWFENLTGQLRYLPSEGAVSGIELEEGAWMIVAGECLMEPCAVAYLTKKMATAEWLNYVQRHAEPGMQWKTKARPQTAEWETNLALLNEYGPNFAVLTNIDEDIKKIDFSASGPLPYKELVDDVHKAWATLWRGADLSTMSGQAGPGQGASLQQSEADILEEADAMFVSEALDQIDRIVLEWRFGEEAPRYAYAKVVVPARRDVDRELRIDDFLLKNGIPIPLNDLRERYSRREPKEGEDVVQAAPEPEPVPGGQPGVPPGGGRNGNGNGNGNEPDFARTLKDLEALAGDSANSFVGHSGRPGQRGGSLPSGEAGSDSEMRTARARGSYNPATLEKQRIGVANEARVAKAIAGINLGDNEPADVVTKTHAIEVKTIVGGKNPKITMHPDSLARKRKYARSEGLKMMTVVIDDRAGKSDIYVKKGAGSFRLSTMKKVASFAALKSEFAL